MELLTIPPISSCTLALAIMSVCQQQMDNAVSMLVILPCSGRASCHSISIYTPVLGPHHFKCRTPQRILLYYFQVVSRRP